MPLLNGRNVTRCTEFTTIYAEDTRIQRNIGTIDCIVTFDFHVEVTGEIFDKGRVDIKCYNDYIMAQCQGRAFETRAEVNLLSRDDIAGWSAAVLVKINEIATPLAYDALTLF